MLPHARILRIASILLALVLGVTSSSYSQSSAETYRVEKARRLRKVNIGNEVNSPYSELSPIISPDGQFLYFTMGSGCPDNLGDGHLQDCYVSRLSSDGRWSTPRNLGAPINSTGNDAISGVSADGSVLFIKNFGYNRLNGFCFARYRGKADWKIDSITIDNYTNESALSTQCISADGKVIIFSAETDNGLGNADLYASFRIEGQVNHYSTPKNLGPIVNTSSDDFAPFLATDGKTLYFSSRGHKGFGDADVFMTKRLDDSWTQWTEPRNLGPQINSAGMDAYYSVPASGDVAYFSSSNGSNHMDIYMMTLADEVRPNPVILVGGKVVNKEGDPLEARITYRHLMTDSVTTVGLSNGSTGRFAVVLPFGERYAVTAESPGYLPFSGNLDLGSVGMFQELRTTITLDTIEQGGSFTLNNIFFEFDKASLKPESHFELDRLFALLSQHTHWVVSIEGFTDSLGSEAHNLLLSRDRALAVKSYLVDRGIPEAHISAAGSGSAHPVAPNDTEEGRSINRRVVITLKRADP